MAEKSNAPQSSIEQINEYFSIEKKHDGRIVIFTVTSIKRAVIDGWAAKMCEIMLAWDEQSIYLSLHDYSGADSFVTTPHLRRRSKENAALRPELNTRTAIVIPESMMAHVTRLFVQALPKTRHSERIRRIFFNRADALAWLEEALSEK